LISARFNGLEPAPTKGQHMPDIAWDEPATLIDLDGKAPMIGTIRDCAMHFAIFKPFAKAQARILLTRPVHREGQKTRTWLLNPDEIELLAERLRNGG
jgi:hypothetical protein